VSRCVGWLTLPLHTLIRIYTLCGRTPLIGGHSTENSAGNQAKIPSPFDPLIQDGLTCSDWQYWWDGFCWITQQFLSHSSWDCICFGFAVSVSALSEHGHLANYWVVMWHELPSFGNRVTSPVKKLRIFETADMVYLAIKHLCLSKANSHDYYT
jgi:hypothetical protein